MNDKIFQNLPIKEVYSDLFSPGFKKVGNALETALESATLIFLPLKLLNEKTKIRFQKHLKNYSIKLTDVQELTNINVQEYIGVPILDKFTLLDENSLSEAFINLLTKASFEETLGFAHPAFINVLNNISQDEAKILFNLKNAERIPYIDIYFHRYVEQIEKPRHFDERRPKSPEELKEMINYNYQDREDRYLKYAWNLTGIEFLIKLDFPDQIDIYIENLEKLGIIVKETNLYANSDKTIYAKFINEYYTDTIDKLESTKPEFMNEGYQVDIDIRKHYFYFTEFGKGFIKACIKDIDIKNSGA